MFNGASLAPRSFAVNPDADESDMTTTLDKLSYHEALQKRVETPDGRVGIVNKIKVSPYWPEEHEGVVRVYVVSELAARGGTNSWTDWCLPTELVVLHD